MLNRLLLRGRTIFVGAWRYRSMKVLLLGATGLLGHNVLQRLTATGHQVVAVVRRRHALRIETPHTMIVEGNITCPQTVWDAARDCDAIVNCAGVTDMSLLRREDYEEVNVGLCYTIANVMSGHGISTLVHVSTVNTIGYGTVDCPADEQAPCKPPFDKSYYADSKRQGELVVLVNPGFMIGPMDVKPSSGRLLLAAYRKPLMFAPQGGKAFVDVRDVAAAVANALAMGRNGQRYIAVNGQGCLTISELYKMQARVMGYCQRVVMLPNGLLNWAGRLGDLLRWMGMKTELSSTNLRQLMVREYYDNSHAISDLSMSETDLAQSIRDFYAWREK